MFKNFNIIIGVVFCILLSHNSFSQTFSKTYKIKETGGTITFSVTPRNVKVQSGGSSGYRTIQYYINFNLDISYSIIPNGAKLRNVQITMSNGNSNATAGTEYGPDLNFPLSSNTYHSILQTSDYTTLSNYYLAQLSDQRMDSNTAILPIAKYQTVKIVFVLQTDKGYSQYTFDDYNSNGDTLLNPTALPIRLLSFNVTQSKLANILNWTTSVETNNNYFVVEKSNDGSSFDSIATIKGAVNSNQLLNYSYSDNEPYYGNNYYRLRQVDYDGNYSYSSIESIYFSGNVVSNSDISIFPNPGNGSINIKGDWDNYSTVRITSMLGQIVYTSNITSNNFTLPNNLAKGLYFINFYKRNISSKTLKYMLH